MAVSVRAKIGGDRRLEGVLTTATSPRVVASAMARSAGELKRQMRIHVSGPRPRRLDVVTGELRDSFRADLSRLPNVVRVGTPVQFWPALHEEGTGKRRKRAFAAPALDRALDRIPDFFAEELERAFDQSVRPGVERQVEASTTARPVLLQLAATT